MNAVAKFVGLCRRSISSISYGHATRILRFSGRNLSFTSHFNAVILCRMFVKTSNPSKRGVEEEINENDKEIYKNKYIEENIDNAGEEIPTQKTTEFNSDKVNEILKKLQEYGIDDAGKEREIEIAAKKGYINEIYEVSKQYAKDDSNKSLYVYILMLSAKGGHPIAQFNLGQMYTQKIMESNATDQVRTQYFERAQYWLLLSFKQGYKLAIIQLGNLFTFTGEIKKSIACYLQATDHPDALYNLGIMYCSNIDGIPYDTKLALHYFEAAAQLDDPHALYYLGQSYLLGNEELQLDKNIPIGVKYLQKSANLKNPDALTSLALLFRKGEYPIPQDPVLMRESLQLASQYGSGYASHLLGVMHLNGSDGIKKDYKKAFQYIQKATKQANEESFYTMGVMYYHGYGVPKDFKKAFDCYKQSAELGNKEALRNMSSMYYLGEGVDKDPQTAKNILNYIQQLEKGNIDIPINPKAPDSDLHKITDTTVDFRQELPKYSQ